MAPQGNLSGVFNTAVEIFGCDSVDN